MKHEPLKERYINPLTDFGFKKLFGTELNKVLLIDFLNQILPKQHIIEELTYSNNAHLGKNEFDRKAIFDLYCTGQNGEKFIVEMQKAKQNFFKDRSVYYSSFPIQEQALKGDWNYQLQAVYTIGILDFKFDEHINDKDLLHVIELKNQKCEVFYDKLKFIYIELPKFTKKEDELVSHFDKWLYVFTHLQKLQDRPEKLQNRVFKRLFEIAEIAKFTPEEREAYQESLKHYRDIKNIVDTSKEEGKIEGLKEGKIEGLKEGKIKGRKEEKYSMAKMMQANGEPFDKIILYTGLTKKELDEL